MHAHRCVNCAKNNVLTVWIHGEESRGSLKAHTCPKCGSSEHGNWERWLVSPGQLPQAGHAAQHVIDPLQEVISVMMALAFAAALVFYCILIYGQIQKLRGVEK